MNTSSSSENMVASLGKRFRNCLIDDVCIYICVFAVSAIMVFGGVDTVAQQYNLEIGLLIVLGYYIFFESLWQRTLGKFLSKTKVVRRDGTKPSFGQIVGRSFARLIPFEGFSFLSRNPIGWHDRLTGTIVVPSSYTPEDVQKIDVQTLLKKKYNAVLIVVIALVAIAIIGIISSVILSGLNSGEMDTSQSQVSGQ